MTEQARAKRPAVDWEAVEREYRIGLKTLRQIADSHGITHGAINKRAKKEGWTRDLSAKVSAKTEELVSKALVSKTVSKENSASERQIVEANANVCARVVLDQRQDLSDSAELERKLMEELLVMTDKVDQFREFGEMMRSPDEFGQDKTNDNYFGAISHAQRVKSAKLLMDMRKARIETERKVLRLDDQKPAEVNPLAELIRAVSGTSLPVVANVPEDDDE